MLADRKISVYVLPDSCGVHLGKPRPVLGPLADLKGQGPVTRRVHALTSEPTSSWDVHELEVAPSLRSAAPGCVNYLLFRVFVAM